MGIKTRKIGSALEKKGFLKKEGGRHTIYYFVVNGKRIGIHTELSRGIKEYSRGLLSAMHKQLKFNNISELEDFIECPLSKDDYIDILKRKNILFW
ncbi:MAG: hypothetical protein MASP_01745 [Candidatus Methanolliviera sp. GoM_asphalt]|nr:MAG: hypothetical protein MASP_01745 [Candidatus Methanolliviera sp. GoM_asphalt]